MAPSWILQKASGAWHLILKKRKKRNSAKCLTDIMKLDMDVGNEEMLSRNSSFEKEANVIFKLPSRSFLKSPFCIGDKINFSSNHTVDTYYNFSFFNDNFVSSCNSSRIFSIV